MLEPDSSPFVSLLALMSDADASSASDAAAAAAAADALRTDADAEAAGGVPGLRERLVGLLAPSKCFNMPALDIAVAVTPHAPLRTAMRAAGIDSAEVRSLRASLYSSQYWFNIGERARAACLDKRRATRLVGRARR